ncbi:hypothetical protein [Methyloversatilis sp. NSM2]|uniref:hypothetical protein n=1 Tax=Methyloversatilis sp. NSM2 TaxID=3134135 RepID=UPI00310F34AD
MIQWSESMIARAIALQTLARKCVVLVDNCGWTGHECDVLAVTTDLRIIDVEVKISRADLKADAKKDKWWRRTFLGYGERKETFNEAGRLIRVERPSLYDVKARQHPPKVWKHYYAMPADIWKPELLDCLPSPASGVLLLRAMRSRIDVECIRRATPAKDAYKLTPEQVMDIARLANLRMWEAYHRRDQSKQQEAVNA